MHTYVTIIIKRKGSISESGGVGGLEGVYLRGKKGNGESDIILF